MHVWNCRTCAIANRWGIETNHFDVGKTNVINIFRLNWELISSYHSNLGWFVSLFHIEFRLNKWNTEYIAECDYRMGVKRQQYNYLNTCVHKSQYVAHIITILNLFDFIKIFHWSRTYTRTCHEHHYFDVANILTAFSSSFFHGILEIFHRY